MVTHGEIEAAERLIRPYIRRTPLLELNGSALGVTGRLYFKLENMQRCGSFKPRGAFNAILSQKDIPAAGVITASGGNHGLAVAAAAQELGIPAEVFVPTTVSKIKVARLETFGARVSMVGRHYPEALVASQQRACESGALTIHAYDQLPVVIGQGTVGLEVAQQAPAIDTVLVAVGGGGLAAGIASWFDDQARVIGVEPQTIPTLAAAMKAGEPVDVEVSGIAADALGARRIGTIALEIALRTGMQSILVSDDDIIDARSALWSELRMPVEYGAAAAFAAIRNGSYVPGADEHVAIIVCGGNTDPSDLVK